MFITEYKNPFGSATVTAPIINTDKERKREGGTRKKERRKKTVAQSLADHAGMDHEVSDDDEHPEQRKTESH